MRARFVHLKKEVDITASMPAPKRVSEINEWLKQARKSIPEIPDTNSPGSVWKVKEHQATLKLVVFTLYNGKAEHEGSYDFCQVVINRQASSLSS